jgi:hypothetical protein
VLFEDTARNSLKVVGRLREEVANGRRRQIGKRDIEALGDFGEPALGLGWEVERQSHAVK